MSSNSSNIEKTRVAVIGATGYAGVELVRLLHGRSDVDITFLGSATQAGKLLGDVFPHFGPAAASLPLYAFDPDAHIDVADVFFMAMENGRAMTIAPALLKADKRVIDLSADFRLKDVATYEKWYRIKHVCPEFLAEAVYGLPEIRSQEIGGARLLANPGCYTTTSILALSPALAAGIVRPDSVIVDAMSGVSGAGRSKASVDYLFTELDENAKAYGVTNHRHTPEIEQELSLSAGTPVTANFTPHLVPLIRGILATCYADLMPDADAASIHGLYEKFYADAPFVQVLSEGTFPTIQMVKGTNNCAIGLVADNRTRRLIVVSATDNLIKGASGQAVQNMNLMLGRPETEGLPMTALYP